MCGRRPRVVLGDQQFGPHRQRRDGRGQPGHQPGTQPVAAVPHPGARGDQHHQQLAAQPLPQPHHRHRPARSPARRPTGAPGAVPTVTGALRGTAGASGERCVDGGRAQRPAPQVTVGEQRVVAARAARQHRAPYRAPAAGRPHQRQRLIGGAQPRGDGRRAAPPGSCRAGRRRRRGARRAPASRPGCRRPAALRRAPGCRGRRADARRPRRGRPGPRASAARAGGARCARRCPEARRAVAVSSHHPARVSRTRSHQGVGGDEVAAVAAAASRSARRRRGSGRAVTSASHAAPRR